MLFKLALVCGLCAVSVQAGGSRDPIAREAAQKANTFVRILVAARCPSQSNKVQNFLLGKAAPAQVPTTFSDLAEKVGEEKALTMAEELCEGAADDKGIVAYNGVTFRDASNLGAALSQVQTKAHLKKAEEEAFIVAEKAFHEALKAQQIQQQKQGMENETKGEQGDESRGDELRQSLNRLPMGPSGTAAPEEHSEEAAHSGTSILFIMFLLVLIGGGIGLAVYVRVLKSRNGGELPPQWAQARDVTGHALQQASAALAVVAEKVSALIAAYREGAPNKSNIAEKLMAMQMKADNEGGVKALAQQALAPKREKSDLDDKVTSMYAKIKQKLHDKGTVLSEQSDILKMEEARP